MLFCRGTWHGDYPSQTGTASQPATSHHCICALWPARLPVLQPDFLALQHYTGNYVYYNQSGGPLQTGVRQACCLEL